MVEMDSNLCGKLLIAMPDMGDPRFAGSVVYMCAHSDEGAMGLIVNKPQPEIRFASLLEQLEIPKSSDVRDIRVHFGGPVENARGFVLHSEDYRSEAGTMEVEDGVCMTATLDVLEDIAKGKGPESSMLKTRGTELQQAVTELAMDIAGNYAAPLDQSTPAAGDNFQAVGPDSANGTAQEYFNTRKVSIYAGSNEIQRNIMSKLVLGL